MGNKITYLDLNNPITRESEQETTANLGALYIISALENEGYEVDYRDYQISKFYNKLKVDSIVKFAEGSTKIILICCMAYMLPLVILAIRKIKEEDPEKLIILGGVGPTGVADKLMREFEDIDIIVKGEGEFTIIELLNVLQVKEAYSRYEALRKVEGIVFRDLNSNVLINSERERNKELDLIDFPAYHIIDKTKYKEFGLITGRGCAFKCKFCDIHGLWGEKYFQRSLDNVFKELNILVKDMGVKQIRIWDDTFTMSNKRVIEFCKRIKKEKLNFQWSCFGRVNLVNEELIESMADCGCGGIFYGLESGSEDVLKKIDKKINIDLMIRAIETSVKYMNVKGHLIWGFPFESCEDLYKTIYLYNYLKNKIDIGISELWPYPTSPLYKEYKHLIKFNPNLDTFYKILPFKEDELEDEKEVLKLVINHSDIFTQFYYYHTDNFMDKYMMIKDLYTFC
ncbi:radical SAM protein [Clostridium sp. KNHs214]|uniref:B12-binding domain-containing radical SAM protein n=1 Tax=Clostridium sp. KNHs214 TaxID=1540257 RepID=UPI0005585850|nr:radical SAM protein [Clostridium sp. KNHs214]